MNNPAECKKFDFRAAAVDKISKALGIGGEETEPNRTDLSRTDPNQANQSMGESVCVSIRSKLT